MSAAGTRPLHAFGGHSVPITEVPPEYHSTNFCARKDWTNPQAVTLTLRLSRLIDGAWVRLSQMDAQQNLRHLLNVIHKKLGAYGFPKRAQLQCLPIFEGREGVRPHIHLMLDRPDCIQSEE